VYGYLLKIFAVKKVIAILPYDPSKASAINAGISLSPDAKGAKVLFWLAKKIRGTITRSGFVIFGSIAIPTICT